MVDNRRFTVLIRGKSESEPMKIKEARQLATDLKRHGESVVIVNVGAKKVFKWWPELGVHSG